MIQCSTIFIPQFLAAVLLFVTPTFILAEEAKKTQPNIILIVADYMGYADIGPFGVKDIQTPALDELAQQGARFNNYYAAAPVCIPSRASLMSGLYPDKALKGFENSRGQGLPSEQNNLLRTLKTAGYRTGLIGKWHLGTEQNFKPNDHGFDYFFGFNSWTLGYHDHFTSTGDPGLYRNDKLVNEKGYLTELFSNEALDFVSEQSTQPFFLYLAYNTGLPPYQKPDLPESKWNTGWDANLATREDYVAMVESMDQGIYGILKKLKALNIDDNTLVIFTYDHGGRHLVDSGSLFHGFSTLWEGGIRVPLIISWPNKVESGKLIEAPTIAMDLTATMVQAANPNANIKSLDGVNLFTMTDKPDINSLRTFYWHHGKMKAVRQGKWKYVVDNNSQMLFNLDTDISERKNHFANQPELAKKLKNALENWEESLKAYD